MLSWCEQGRCSFALLPWWIVSRHCVLSSPSQMSVAFAKHGLVSVCLETGNSFVAEIPCRGSIFQRNRDALSSLWRLRVTLLSTNARRLSLFRPPSSSNFRWNALWIVSGGHAEVERNLKFEVCRLTKNEEGWKEALRVGRAPFDGRNNISSLTGRIRRRNKRVESSLVLSTIRDEPSVRFRVAILEKGVVPGVAARRRDWRDHYRHYYRYYP